MSILKRINWTFKAAVNSLLSKAEDPEQMIQIAVEQMEQSLQKNIGIAAKVQGAKQTLQNRLNLETQRRSEVVRKLQYVIENNKTEYIAVGQAKLAEVDQSIDLLKDQLAKIDQQSQELMGAIATQKDELSRMKKKQQGLVAQARAGKVIDEVYKELDFNSSTSAMGLFSRQEEKIQAMSATGWVRSQLYGSDFDRLPMASPEIEKELAGIKQGLSLPGDSLKGSTVTQTTTTWSREGDGTFSIPPIKPIEPIKPMREEPQDFFNV